MGIAAAVGFGLGGALIGGSVFSAGRKASRSLTHAGNSMGASIRAGAQTIAAAGDSIGASVRSGAHEIAEAGISASSIHAKILAAAMLDCLSEFNTNNQRLANEFNANNRQCIDHMVDCIRHVSDDFNANNRQIVGELINWANGHVHSVGASLKRNLFKLSFLFVTLHATIIGVFVLVAASLINPQHLTTIHDASIQTRYSLYDLAYITVSIIGYTVFWYIQYLLVSQLLAKRYDKLFRTIMSINPLATNIPALIPVTRPFYVQCFHVIFPRIQANIAPIAVDLHVQLANTRPFALSFLVTQNNGNNPLGHTYMTLHLGQNSNPPIAFLERCYNNYQYYSRLHDTVIIPWNADGIQSVSIECSHTLIDGSYPGTGNSNWFELKLVGIWSN